jgi:hypothetical protein
MDFETHEVGRPGDLTFLPNGNLGVVDGQTKTVLIVNEEGEILSTFGKEGRGPKEFIRLTQILVTDNHINIVDISQYKVLEFDFEGNYMDNYAYQSRAFDRTLALDEGRVYYTGASGENNSLIKRVDPDADSAFFFAEAKGSLIEDMDMEATRNEIKKGNIPPYFKNNANLVLGENHIYAFLDSYSELRKYDLNGNLIWERKIELPDNQVLFDQIVEAATKVPNALPFLRYTQDVDIVNDMVYLLGSNPGESPQHLTVVNAEEGNIETIYELPGSDYYFTNFAVHPSSQNIYFSDIMKRTVFKTKLP